MNTVHSPQVTLGNSIDRAAAQIPVRADRRADIYEMWKLVFERARVSSTSQSSHHNAAGTHAAAHQSDSAAPQGNSTRAATDEFAPRTTAFRGVTIPGVASAAIPNAAAIASANDSPNNESTTTASCGAKNDTIVSQVAQTAVSDLEASVASPVSRSNGLESRDVAGEANSFPGAESVNVFVLGAAVAVVVRDANISDATALQCAFETASELTGQRAALQRLTVNGRTVYEQLDHSATQNSKHRLDGRISLLTA